MLVTLQNSLTTHLDRSIRVPLEEAADSDLSSDQVKINPKYGGGFPANVEGLQHLQCLVRILLLHMKME
jgi:hypothetical protein